LQPPASASGSVVSSKNGLRRCSKHRKLPDVHARKA
jgi:hypothetical protein